MSKRYDQGASISDVTRFAAAPGSDVQFSRMTSNPRVWTTLNAGDIVPIYCAEVLPRDSFSVDVDAVIRQTTLLTPTMDNMEVDIYAFFVPNRVVNRSWSNVMGENSSGTWTSPDVALAPLLADDYTGDTLSIPVGSVADYYGFPTQVPIRTEHLKMCNDLKFRGYLEIYNEFFRDQNYQPPIPYSKLNVYEGFFAASTESVGMSSSSRTLSIAAASAVSDGGYGAGSVIKELYGEGSPSLSSAVNVSMRTHWSALDKPLKANKLHDYFTSVLPSPQKGRDVVFSIGGMAPLKTGSDYSAVGGSSDAIRFGAAGLGTEAVSNVLLFLSDSARTANRNLTAATSGGGVSAPTSGFSVTNTNLYADLSKAGGLSVNDVRLGFAMQQTFEHLGRSGSRYREFVWSFFGLETEDPYKDIPEYLGHVRRSLDIYQTAQTAPSAEGSTPQGNLAAFGYTSTSGELFHKTFLEHGYVHIFAVVRHRNVYSSYLARDNFRRSMFDFYVPELANISEQPVYTREINPFVDTDDGVFGYQEAWAEYRFDPDRVSGYMRPGVSESLGIWNYADDLDTGLEIADGDFITSNSEEVLNRSLSVTSETAPQFKAQFGFRVTKERPMPTYSVPGLNIV